MNPKNIMIVLESVILLVGGCPAEDLYVKYGYPIELINRGSKIFRTLKSEPDIK